MEALHHILYVGGDAPHRDRHVARLEELGFQVVRATSARDALVRLESTKVDCIVSTRPLPDMSLLRFYELADDRYPEIPHVVVGPLDGNQRNQFTSTPIEYLPNEEALTSVVEAILTQGAVDMALAEHEALLDSVQAIARDLLETPSSEAIYQLIYEHLAALDRYQFVWVATPDISADQLELHAPTETIVDLPEFASVIGADTPAFIRQAVDDGRVRTTESDVTTRGATAATSAQAPTPTTESPADAKPDMVTACVPFTHDGAVHGVVLLSTRPADASELGATERDVLAELGRLVGRALAASEGDELLEPAAFASVVVHELVNPLNVAQASLQQARETDDPEWFERAERALRRIEHVLQDELSLLRGAEIDELTVCDLDEAATNAWVALETEGAELVVEDSLTIRADQALLECLLTNLFDNALKHGGDSVAVTVGALPDGFTVSDDGPGIATVDRERIFELGYTTGSGTGLGLAIVSRIVEAHGWAIDVTESVDGGAQFEITGVDTIEQQ